MKLKNNLKKRQPRRMNHHQSKLKLKVNKLFKNLILKIELLKEKNKIVESDQDQIVCKGIERRKVGVKGVIIIGVVPEIPDQDQEIEEDQGVGAEAKVKVEAGVVETVNIGEEVVTIDHPEMVVNIEKEKIAETLVGMKMSKMIEVEKKGPSAIEICI